MKLLNPRFPFMLRANPAGEPYMFVEYDFGKKVRDDLQVWEKAVSGVTLN